MELDKFAVAIVACCGVTLFGVVIACLGIDSVIIGAIIGMYLLIVREIVGEKINKKVKEEDKETEAEG